MANLQIRLDDDLRRQAHETAANMGLDLATAVRMFLKQMVRENGLPFKPSADPFYSESNMAFLRASLAQLKAGKASMHELMEDD